MSMIEIRKLDKSDWQILKDVRVRALKDSPAAFAESFEDCRNFNQSFWEGRASSDSTKATFIAFEESTPIGMVACFSDGAIFNLVAMWVSPEYRGTGVSSELVNRVIEFAKSNRIPKIDLVVNESNKIASKFFKKLGFRMKDDVTNPKTDIDVGKLSMFQNIT